MTKSLDKKLLNVLKQWNNENVDVSIFENVLNSTKNFLNWDIDVLWVVLWLRETLYQARGGKFHWKIQLLPYCSNNSQRDQFTLNLEVFKGTSLRKS